MFQNLQIVALQVLILFLLMAVGFFFAKAKKLDKAGADQLSSLLLYIVTPCVIVNSLQVENNPEMLKNMGVAFLLASVVYLIGFALSPLFFRKQPEGARSVLRACSIYSNCGYMGLPLVQAVLGEEAVIYAAISVVALNLQLWTLGARVMGGAGKIPLRKILVNPGTLGLVLGLPLFLLSIRLPGFLATPVTMFANLNTPVAMVVCGVYIAFSDLRRCFTQGRLYFASFLRLVLYPGIFLGLMLLLPVRPDPLLFAAVAITASAPTAAATTVLAADYQRDTALSSQMITVTTLLSILTMPVFAALVQSILGL